MVMIRLVVEQLLSGIDHSMAAGEGAVDPLAGVIPKRQANRPAFTIGAAEGVIVKLLVFPGRSMQQVDLFGIEQ